MKRADERPVIAILCGGGLTHAAGGIGQFSRYLLDAWADTDDGAARRVIDTRGGGGRVAGAMAFARASWTIAMMLATGRLGLLNANMSTRGSAWRKCALCRLAQSAGVPTVMHLHGADFREYRAGLPRRNRAWLDTTLRRATRVIVLGRCWRDLLVNEAGVAPDRVVVVANGVPAPRGADPGPAGDAPPGIVMIGRLGARKGVPELLEALARPELLTLPWRATLAGDGDVDGFRRRAERIGLGGRVALPGWLDRKQVSALLEHATIFVLASHHEGMPLAVIEALSHGVAVIATPVGANPEFLTHDVNALLVAPGDAPALAHAIARLLNDAGLRRRIALAGRATFERHLSIEVAATAIRHVHRAAMLEWQAREVAPGSSRRNQHATAPAFEAARRRRRRGTPS